MAKVFFTKKNVSTRIFPSPISVSNIPSSLPLRLLRSSLTRLLHSINDARFLA